MKLEKIVSVTLMLPPPQYWPALEKPELWYVVAGLTTTNVLYQLYTKYRGYDK